MVTFLESGLIGHFNSVFIFLFVFIVVWAILGKIKILGENAGINAIIAIILAAFFAVSSTASKIFEYATPWLILLFLVLLFMNLIMMFLGAEKTFLHPAGNVTAVSIIAIVIGIIFLLAAGQVIQENKAQKEAAGVNVTATNTFAHQIGDVLRTPEVLGLLLITLIATFAIMLLAGGGSITK